MFTPTQLKLLLASAAIAALALGLPILAPSVASGIITPSTVAEFWANDETTHFDAVQSLLPPMGAITLTAISPENIQAPDARPFALFNAATAKTATAAGVLFRAEYVPLAEQPSDTTPLTPDIYNHGQISFRFVACLKYTLPEGVVVVTSVQPSPLAARLKLLLGDTPITLANGTPAWATENVLLMGINGVPAEAIPNFKEIHFANRVTWTHEDLIITVASNLPIKRLQELAVEVVMK